MPEKQPRKMRSKLRHLWPRALSPPEIDPRFFQRPQP
ncbi:unknown protein [Azorhizobium caulinodans ORS 571]|uniref:Uncharacterized protein n=1 Tax=Azorhizobium caulinodans (strain ATCC 43989 / DSM 5975 / JCM 20966 / LMG 6465 / NBRC 14845 / NCIMB 13405 / ORS 571) TaxID=438753 RepID=A8IQL0_AZOC5|nr:unknown protein [Azorhizobium caulinodans ORS 571]